MNNTTLPNEEKRCLQMWFRQAIAHLEKEEACRKIAAFYAGSATPRKNHHAPLVRRARRAAPAHLKELV